MRKAGEGVSLRKRTSLSKLCGVSDENWSGKRDLNPRPSPWQGDALPLSYSRIRPSEEAGFYRRHVKTVKRARANIAVSPSNFSTTHWAPSPGPSHRLPFLFRSCVRSAQARLLLLST